MRVGHVVTVKEGEHIFLKAVGVVDCVEFNQQIIQLTSKGTEAFHLRNDLPGERKAVLDAILADKLQTLPAARNINRRSALVAKRATIAPSMVGSKGKGRVVALRWTYVSDDNIEPAIATVHKRKRVPNEPTNTRCLHTFLHAETSEDNLGWPSTSSSSSTAPLRASPVSSLSSASSFAYIKPEPGTEDPLTGVGLSLKRAINVDEEDQLESEDNMDDEEVAGSEEDVIVSKVWPTEFHTVDIVEGFHFIHEQGFLGSLIEDTFSIQFEGNRYVKTTYNDHLRRWTHASQSAKDKALAAGRTPAGLWSRFMAENPSPYAVRKAAKKCLRNAEHRREQSGSP